MIKIKKKRVKSTQSDKGKIYHGGVQSDAGNGKARLSCSTDNHNDYGMRTSWQRETVSKKLDAIRMAEFVQQSESIINHKIDDGHLTRKSTNYQTCSAQGHRVLVLGYMETAIDIR